MTNPKEKAIMEGFMNIVTGGGSKPGLSNVPDMTYKGKDPIMHDILTGFREATQSVAEDVKYEPKFKHALETKKVDNGVTIGDWLIEKSQRGYNIINQKSGDAPLIKDLKVYEAAKKVATLLSEGYHVNHPNVWKLLSLEATYVNNLNDVKHWKKLYENTTDTRKAAIYEDRYYVARDNAIRARDALKSS